MNFFVCQDKRGFFLQTHRICGILEETSRYERKSSMKFRRIISLVLLICALLSLSACKDKNIGMDETFADNGKHTLKAWSGAFSEEELKNAITTYEQEYTPIALDNAWQATVTLDVTIKSFSITRVSPVGDDFSELQDFVDLSVPAQYNKETGTLVIDCSFMNDPENSKTQWSFLLKVTTSSNEQIRYYTRVYYPKG